MGRIRSVSRASFVASALALLAVAQGVAALQVPRPLQAAALSVPKEAFGFAIEQREVTVTFQLRNDGDGTVVVTGVGESLPGLELVDVVATGTPLDFRESGRGAGPLEPFDLQPEAVALMVVTYRLVACNAVPAQPQPVPVGIRSGRATGQVRVGLPQLPSDAASAADTDVVEWQRVMVRDLCG